MASNLPSQLPISNFWSPAQLLINHSESNSSSKLVQDFPNFIPFIIWSPAYSLFNPTEPRSYIYLKTSTITIKNFKIKPYTILKDKVSNTWAQLATPQIQSLQKHWELTKAKSVHHIWAKLIKSCSLSQKLQCFRSHSDLLLNFWNKKLRWLKK